MTMTPLTFWKKIIWLASILLILVIMPALYFNGKFGTHMILTRSNFSLLPGWREDNHKDALIAFKHSCEEILKRNPDSHFSNVSFAGLTRSWQTICKAADNLTTIDEASAKTFFERWFQPYQLKNNYNPNGLFTGYYLPSIAIQYTQDKNFSIPIYAAPKDLVKIDLGKFNKNLAGVIITAQINQNKLQPYPDRASITKKPLKNAEIIAWTNNPIDFFFAQIQGSAIGILPDNSQVMLSYAVGNGRPYKPIGKILLNKKALAPNNISMQSIHAWLTQHPTQINDILNLNASYNFFVLRKAQSIIGTEQVALTPARSLAVDKKFIPLGAPLWLSTQFTANNNKRPFKHLMLAQDTGGAINGIVRGDIFWGASKEAADIAGHMQDKGQLWILLPRRTL